jgi:hypothetical protein
MPFDPDGAFAPADPTQSARIRALPRIIVHPKPPPSLALGDRPSGTASDGLDDWFVPSTDGYPDDWFVPNSDGYPDDWFVPAQSTSPGTGQPAPAAQPGVTNPTLSNPSAVPRDPFAAYWSLIPASRVGAMAWDPPNLPLFGPSPSTNNSPAPSLPPAWPIPAGSRRPTLGIDGLPWSSAKPRPSAAIPEGGLFLDPSPPTNNFSAPTPPAVRSMLFESRRPTLGVDGLPWSSTPPRPSPANPQGGLFGGLVRFGTSPRAWPEGGLLSGLIRPGATSPGAGELPSLAPPRSADSAVVVPDQSRSLTDYSAGERSSESWPVYVDQLQCMGRCHGFDAGTPRPMTPEEELVLNLLTFAATLPIPAVGGLRGVSAARGVSAYEVGGYNALKARSIARDGLQVHHAVQASPAEQIIPGYLRRTGPSIVLPEKEHEVIPKIMGSYAGTPRDLLARDIRNLRTYAEAAHNSAIQDLIELNKTMYPKAFTK